MIYVRAYTTLSVNARRAFSYRYIYAYNNIIPIDDDDDRSEPRVKNKKKKTFFIHSGSVVTYTYITSRMYNNLENYYT